jgi:hypothetical protein
MKVRNLRIIVFYIFFKYRKMESLWFIDLATSHLFRTYPIISSSLKDYKMSIKFLFPWHTKYISIFYIIEKCYFYFYSSDIG